MDLKPRETWQKGAKACSLCGTKFSIVRGRNVHHCRLCGQSFCSGCASKKINQSIIQSINQSISQGINQPSNPLASQTNEKVRVCDPCFDKCTGHMVDAAIHQSASQSTSTSNLSGQRSISQSSTQSENQSLTDEDARRSALDQSNSQSINRFLREQKKRVPLLMPNNLDERLINHSVDQSIDQTLNPLKKSHSRTSSINQSISQSTDPSLDPFSPSVSSRSFSSVNELTNQSSNKSISRSDLMSPHSRAISNPPSPKVQSNNSSNEWDLSTVPSVADLSISPIYQSFKQRITTLHQSINQSTLQSNKQLSKAYRTQRIDATDRWNHIKLIVQSIKQSINHHESQAENQSTNIQELHDRLAFFTKQENDYSRLIDWLDQSINQPDQTNRMFKIRLIDRIDQSIMIDVVDCLIDRLIGSLRLRINHGKISIEVTDCKVSINLINLSINAINQSGSSIINQSILKGLSSLISSDLSINLSIKRIFIPVTFVPHRSANQPINQSTSQSVNSGDWLVNEAGAVYDIQIVKPANQTADHQSKSSFHESLINWLIKRYLPRTINQSINKSIPPILGPFFQSINQAILIEGLIDCSSEFPTPVWEAPLHQLSTAHTHSDQARSSTIKSINEFKQSNSQSNNQPNNQSINQSIDQSNNQPAIQSVDPSRFLWRMQLLANMLQAGKLHKSVGHSSKRSSQSASQTQEKSGKLFGRSDQSASTSVNHSNNLGFWSQYIRTFSTCLNNQSDWMRLMITWQQTINQIEQSINRTSHQSIDPVEQSINQMIYPSSRQSPEQTVDPLWFFDFISAVARANDQPINLAVKVINQSIGFSIVEATRLYNQSISHSINQTVDQLRKKENEKKAKLLINQQGKPSNSLLVNQPTKQTHTPNPVNQSLNRAINQTIQQSRPRSYSSPVTSPRNQPFVESTDQVNDHSNGISIVLPSSVIDQSIDLPTDESKPSIMIDLDSSNSHPANQSREQSIDSPRSQSPSSRKGSMDGSINQSKEAVEIDRLTRLSVVHEQSVNQLIVQLIDVIKNVKFNFIGELNGEPIIPTTQSQTHHMIDPPVDQLLNHSATPATIKLSIEQLAAALSLPSINLSIAQSIRYISQSIYQIPSLKVSTLINQSSGAFEVFLYLLDQSINQSINQNSTRSSNPAAHKFKLDLQNLALNLFPSFIQSINQSINQSTDHPPVDISLARLGFEGPLKPLIDYSDKFDIQSFSKVVAHVISPSASQSIDQTIKDEMAKSDMQSNNQSINQTNNQSLLKSLSTNGSIDYQSLVVDRLIDRSIKLSANLSLAISPGAEYRLMNQSINQTNKHANHHTHHGHHHKDHAVNPTSNQPSDHAKINPSTQSRSHSRTANQSMDVQAVNQSLLSQSGDNTVPPPLPARPQAMSIEQHDKQSSNQSSDQSANQSSASKSAAELYATPELTPGGSAAIVTIDQATHKIHIPPSASQENNQTINQPINQITNQMDHHADQPINIVIDPSHDRSTDPTNPSGELSSAADNEVLEKLKSYEYYRIDISKPTNQSIAQSISQSNNHTDDSCLTFSFRTTLVQLVADAMTMID